MVVVLLVFYWEENKEAISSGKHIFVTAIGILLKQSSLTTAHKNPKRNYDNFISLSLSVSLSLSFSLG